LVRITCAKIARSGKPIIPTIADARLSHEWKTYLARIAAIRKYPWRSRGALSNDKAFVSLATDPAPVLSDGCKCDYQALKRVTALLNRVRSLSYRLFGWAYDGMNDARPRSRSKGWCNHFGDCASWDTPTAAHYESGQLFAVDHSLYYVGR
jgi:hypothetical protein